MKRTGDLLFFPDLEGSEPIFPAGQLPDLVHLTCSHPRETSLQGINECYTRFVAVLQKQENRLSIVRRKFEFLNIADGKICVLLGLQNPPQDVKPGRAARWMKSNGIIFTTLAYNGANTYGGGYYEKDLPITETGKDFVRACTKHGIAVDLSHGGLRMIDGVMDLVGREGLETKVVVTHAGLSSVYNNARNLPDYVLTWVAEREGIIGIPFFTFFLSPVDNTIECYISHIKYAVGKFGWSRVCIATDTPYTSRTREEYERHFAKLAAELDPQRLTMQGRTEIPKLQHPMEYYCPEKLWKIREALLKHFSEREIDGICGGNFSNWCSRNLPY